MNHLTIEEAKKEIDRLNNELELYLEKKQINFERTLPSSSKLKDIIPGKTDSISIFDKFTHYIIKDEECDDKIYQLLETINAYERFIIRETKRLSKIEPHKMKVYSLRNDGEFIKKNNRKRTWNEIGDILGYSERQAQRIYNDILNGKL